MARGQVVPRHRSHADLPPSPGLQRDVRLLILSHIEFAKPVFDGFLRDTVGQLATEVQRIRPWYVPDHGVARVAEGSEHAARDVSAGVCQLRSEVNNSLIIVNFFHKIQNFRQISDLFSQI